MDVAARHRVADAEQPELASRLRTTFCARSGEQRIVVHLAQIDRKRPSASYSRSPATCHARPRPGRPALARSPPYREPSVATRPLPSRRTAITRVLIVIRTPWRMKHLGIGRMIEAADLGSEKPLRRHDLHRGACSRPATPLPASPGGRRCRHRPERARPASPSPDRMSQVDTTRSPPSPARRCSARRRSRRTPCRAFQPARRRHRA